MNLPELKDELDQLIKKGKLLYYSLAVTSGAQSIESIKEKALIRDLRNTDFYSDYQTWYSIATPLIKEVLTHRYDDFISYYKPRSDRKSINSETYVIADALEGVYLPMASRTTPEMALPKLKQQLSILEAAREAFESSLRDLRAILQADFFDDELDAAEELQRKGFLRAAGAVAGVVLESHLKTVCLNRALVIQKVNPHIADYNNYLKENEVLDVPSWRRIQHLGDLRNLCDHQKDREPTQQEVEDLIAGVRYVSKNLS